MSSFPFLFFTQVDLEAEEKVRKKPTNKGGKKNPKKTQTTGPAKKKRKTTPAQDRTVQVIKPSSQADANAENVKPVQTNADQQETVVEGLSSCVVTVCKDTGGQVVLQSTGSGRSRGMGVMYWCTDDVTDSPELYEGLTGADEAAKLFHNIGGSLYVDRAPSSQQKKETGDESVRLALWHENSIQKMQRTAAGRFEVTLDFDAVVLLKENLEGMRECDKPKFLGYALHLGNHLFLTIERNDCVVNIRKWFVPSEQRASVGGQEVELLPTRSGLRLNYGQFRRLADFLETVFLEMFPQFNRHVFVCDQPDHEPTACKMCSLKGMVPVQKHVFACLDNREYELVSIEYVRRFIVVK